MQNIITVRYQDGGRNYDFDPLDFRPRVGDKVIVDTSRGEEFATVTRSLRIMDEALVHLPLRTMLRMATPADIQRAKQLREREKSTAILCREKVIEHKLDMKIVAVQFPFSGDKMVVLFTAEGRIDFRTLVRDLASALRMRVELRQIGVRDETRLLGGIAPCGKVFCCNEFLKDFHPVSIKMAKTQGLSLNPTKISGACGRLMCCLKYEQDAYEDATKRLPKDGSYVETPDGTGTIHGINMLRETMKVRLDQSNEPAKSYYADELLVVRYGKGKIPEDYVPSPKAEMEKRRRSVTVKKEDAPLVSSLGTRIGGLEIFDEPQNQQPPQPEKNRSRNRRRRSGGNGGVGDTRQATQPKQNETTAAPKQQPKPQQRSQPPANQSPKPQTAQQPGPQPKQGGEQGAQAFAQGGDAAKKRSRFRNRNRNRNRKPGGGATGGGGGSAE